MIKNSRIFPLIFEFYTLNFGLVQMDADEVERGALDVFPLDLMLSNKAIEADIAPSSFWVSFLKSI